MEAISPTLPNDDVRQDMSPLKSTKDELLQNINKIDREILQTESQISKLRKKHVRQISSVHILFDNKYVLTARFRTGHKQDYS